MHDFEPHSLKEQIAAAAAAMVVEEGLEYGPAKRRALKQLQRRARRSAGGRADGRMLAWMRQC